MRNKIQGLITVYFNEILQHWNHSNLTCWKCFSVIMRSFLAMDGVVWAWFCFVYFCPFWYQKFKILSWTIRKPSEHVHQRSLWKWTVFWSSVCQFYVEVICHKGTIIHGIFYSWMTRTRDDWQSIRLCLYFKSFPFNIVWQELTLSTSQNIYFRNVRANDVFYCGWKFLFPETRHSFVLKICKSGFYVNMTLVRHW